MASIGTPFTDGATRVMLCGSGELGKEVFHSGQVLHRNIFLAKIWA